MMTHLDDLMQKAGLTKHDSGKDPIVYPPVGSGITFRWSDAALRDELLASGWTVAGFHPWYRMWLMRHDDD